GIIDDDFVGAGDACGSAEGTCQPGALACIDGQEVCVGGVGPSPETCNGLDDDCDGFIDDNLTDAGATCGTDVGGGAPGPTLRQAGSLVCSGQGPVPEICDGKDNDCDGQVDNAPADVGPAFGCGSDVGECRRGFLECQAGQRVCN